MLEILPEFEVGLTDIEGFSHVFVIWDARRRGWLDEAEARRRD
jgi:tRNA (Thr-GGU) A37 N-methylase